MIVVVACPDRVHRAETHILVDTAIASNDVIQQGNEAVGVNKKGVARAQEVGIH